MSDETTGKVDVLFSFQEGGLRVEVWQDSEGVVRASDSFFDGTQHPISGIPALEESLYGRIAAMVRQLRDLRAAALAERSARVRREETARNLVKAEVLMNRVRRFGP